MSKRVDLDLEWSFTHDFEKQDAREVQGGIEVEADKPKKVG